MALPLILVLLLALTLLGHGALLLARREMMASRAFLHATRAEMASVGALHRGLEVLSPAMEAGVPGTLLPLSSEWTGDGLWLAASIRWLGPELFLMEGEGGSRGWPGIRRTGALGWRLAPLIRLGSLQAGLELGGTMILGPMAAALAATPGVLPTGWDPSACEAWEAAIDSLFAGRTLGPFLETSIPPSIPPESGGAIPPLGMLPGREIFARLHAGGTVIEDGAHVPASRSCTDPERPVFLGSEGSLIIRDTAVCGFLVVPGDVLVEGTARFQGLALVGGDLLLSGESRFEGAARVRGSALLENSAIFRASACPVLLALQNAPPVLKPFVFPGASRVHLY